jgi:hypothetical protein
MLVQQCRSQEEGRLLREGKSAVAVWAESTPVAVGRVVGTSHGSGPGAFRDQFLLRSQGPRGPVTIPFPW